MKLENLQRANDLAIMKQRTFEYINKNLKAIEMIDSALNGNKQLQNYFSVDTTLQASVNETINSKYLKHIELYKDNIFYKDSVECVVPLDLLKIAIEQETKRLQARLEEIDKEIESLWNMFI